MISRILKLAISLIFHIFYKCLSIILRFFGQKIPGTLAILQYHKVSLDQKIKFAQQMDELLKISKPVFADFRGPLLNGMHYASVTFDDGFQCVVDNALPELYKRKIPVTLFIPTEFLAAHPGWIKRKNCNESNEILISVDQLSSLPTDLVMVGSHCLTHSNLTELTNEDVKRELIESKRKLERILHIKINLLAFPFGAFNNEILMFSKYAGYERCFSSIPTFPSHKINKYLIGRINVSADDWLIEFRLKVLGAYQWLPYGIIMKRKLKNFFYFFKVLKLNF